MYRPGANVLGIRVLEYIFEVLVLVLVEIMDHVLVLVLVKMYSAPGLLGSRSGCVAVTLLWNVFIVCLLQSIFTKDTATITLVYF